MLSLPCIGRAALLMEVFQRGLHLPEGGGAMGQHVPSDVERQLSQDGLWRLARSAEEVRWTVPIYCLHVIVHFVPPFAAYAVLLAFGQ
jgi:hypothetical protein